MSALYLHIPFCRKACVYCDFHFSTQIHHKEELVKAIEKEILERANEWKYGVVKSIYFGGGTPSVLSADEINRLLTAIGDHYPLEVDEVTLEANPEDVHSDYLQALRQIGINRLSVGLQSFRQADLDWMGRKHTVAQAKSIPALLAQNGYDNYSVDLIFGMPGMTAAEWESQLQFLLDARVPHISLYGLTIEQKTVLQHWVEKGRFSPAADEQMLREYETAEELLLSAGYKHYEISNYALPGFEAKHNSRYWNRSPYLGFGPSAHSFTGRERRWNVANNARYAEALESGKPYAESEKLSPEDCYNEMIMTGLRREKGVNLTQLTALGKPYLDHFLAEIVKKPDFFIHQEESVLLRREHWMQADGIAADLFLINKNSKL